jgi:hypothetical protein
MAINEQFWVPVILTVISGTVGAGISYGVMKGTLVTKVANLVIDVTRVEADLKVLEGKVIYSDTCEQCQEKWKLHNGNLKEDIGEIKQKLASVLDHLLKRGTP